MAALPTAPSLVVPTKYNKYYACTPDIVQGDYTRLFAIHNPTNGTLGTDIFETVISSSNRTPKVFLAQVHFNDGRQCIIAVHPPSTFEPDLLEPSPLWQDKTIAFVGDIQGNGSNFIKTVIFPSKSFDVTNNQLVPTLAKMTNQFVLNANETVGPYIATNPNTETISTRLLIPVPHHYVCLVLNKTFTPCQLWDQLGCTIIANGHQVDCALLLNRACSRHQ